MSTNLKKATNVEYDNHVGIWKKMRDVFAGEQCMKDESLSQNISNFDGTDELKPLRTFDQYLRPTDLMRRIPEIGIQRFCDYIFRATFYPFPLDVKKQSKGLIENQPATFELPSKLKGLIEDCNSDNEDIQMLLSEINSQQLEVSRVGLLLAPSNEKNKPFNIALYSAESILDWETDVDENSERQLVWLKLNTGDTIDNKPVFLILFLDESGQYYQYKTLDENSSYKSLTDESENINGFDWVQPTSSEKSIDKIPFVIVNLTKLGTDIEKPFFESLADASISLFRASAHYEDALYWGGESTLFTKGYGLSDESPGIFVGNGSKNITNLEYADAHYVTMGTDGIAPRKDNMNALFEYCVSLGVDLIQKGTESGVALNIRSNIKTASLKTLAITGAMGLERLLKIAAHWSSQNENDVVITANTTFADIQYTAEDFVKFSSLVMSGHFGLIDMYQLQKRNKLTDAETFDIWKASLPNPTNDDKNVNIDTNVDDNS